VWKLSAKIQTFAKNDHYSITLKVLCKNFKIVYFLGQSPFYRSFLFYRSFIVLGQSSFYRFQKNFTQSSAGHQVLFDCKLDL